MFIELTQENDEKVTINVSSITCFMEVSKSGSTMEFVVEDSLSSKGTLAVNEPSKEASVIYFANGDYVKCKESYAFLKKILANQSK
jgi:hypothetical protein